MPVAYGLGRFWCDLPDLDVHANDLHPDKGDTSHDFTDTPWPDRWWPCVVFDPPYRIGGTPSTPEFDDAYGIEVPRPAAEVRALIEDGAREAVRLSSEFVLVKVQDHVSSGRLQPLTKWVTEAAETAGGPPRRLGSRRGRPRSTDRHAPGPLPSRVLDTPRDAEGARASVLLGSAGVAARPDRGAFHGEITGRTVPVRVGRDR